MGLIDLRSTLAFISYVGRVFFFILVCLCFSSLCSSYQFGFSALIIHTTWSRVCNRIDILFPTRSITK